MPAAADARRSSVGPRLRSRRGVSGEVFRIGWTAAVVATLMVAGCGSPEPDDPIVIEGRRVFLEAADPACGTCHTLSDAETESVVGPDLDALAPDSAQTSVAVRYGVGVMPTQVGILTEEEIAAVARYLATVTGEQDD